MPRPPLPVHRCDTCGADRDLRVLHRLDRPDQRMVACADCLRRRVVHLADSAADALEIVRGLPLSGYEAWRTDHQHMVLRAAG